VGVDQPTVAVKATQLNESAQEPKITVETDSPYQSVKITEFRELKLSESILQGVAELNYNRPSQIQALAIPAILANPPQNFLGQAQSGSGKTAAFGLSMLGRVDENLEEVQGVCIAPTRELTRQIHDNISKLAKFTKVHVLLALPDTAQKLPNAVKSHIIVSTPGTFISMMENRKFDSKKIKIFVLDEADELLKVAGSTNENQAKKIITRLGAKCQICLFSATYNNKVLEFANALVRAKVKIEIPPEKLTLDKLYQSFIRCTGPAPKFEDIRLKVLDTILSTVTVGQTIIFVHKIETGKKVFELMKAKGHSLSLLFGRGMEENQRDDIIDSFRSGRNRTLISTNVIARGLDVLRVSLVINFDVPMDKDENPEPETYLHRIGRSARWQNPGLAITFVHDKDSYEKMVLIAQHFRKEISQRSAESVEQLNGELKEYGITD